MITKANAIPNAIAWCLANPGLEHRIPTRLIYDRMRDAISMTDIQSVKLTVDTDWTTFTYNPPTPETKPNDD
jgi:hypothetical protein